MFEMMNIGLRLFIELFGLLIYGYWGFQVGNTAIQKSIFCISVPLMVAIIWAMFGSPNASFTLPIAAHFVVEMIIFLLPVVLLINVNKVVLAYVFGGIFIVNKIVLLYYGS
ncbi:YrdB family protein [Rummeliibacillus sp. JY-2-4R]